MVELKNNLTGVNEVAMLVQDAPTGFVVDVFGDCV
jgi:hypothetical protein